MLFYLWRHDDAQSYLSAVVRAESSDDARALVVGAAITPDAQVGWATCCCEALDVEGLDCVVLTDDSDLEST